MADPGYYEGLLQQGYGPEFVSSLRQTGETLEQRQARTRQDLYAKELGRVGDDIRSGLVTARQLALRGQPALGDVQNAWRKLTNRMGAPIPGTQADIAARQPPAPKKPDEEVVPAATMAPAPAIPQTTDEMLQGMNIPTVAEGFGDPYVSGSTYYKVMGPDGKPTYTNIPGTVAKGLGGSSIPEELTGLGTQLRGPGGTAEVVLGGRSLPGPDASRAEIEALPEQDQVRWYQRMMGARASQGRAIQDRLGAFNLQEATLPWDQRVTRMAQKQAALYDYLKKMPEFARQQENLTDELVDGWKRDHPVEAKDPEKLAAFVREAERLAEQKANKDLQERMMMIMMGTAGVAGAYARNPMYGMGAMGGLSAEE